jgi:succinyl-diaminopimelate desuccinylase
MPESSTPAAPSPVSFLQDLIRIPSMPGEEAQIAARVLEEMRTLGFDAAWTDAKGNAYGLYRGLERGPAWMLMTHLDHIDVGDLSLWEHPPFAAVLENAGLENAGLENAGLKNAIVHGRGAVDIKGQLATHVYTVANMIARGVKPKRDIVVVAPVFEEIGGEGAEYMCKHLPLQAPDGSSITFGACIVAEPSGNRVMLGHRGVSRATVSFHGEAHHASFGLYDKNPHFALGKFLERLSKFSFPSHPVLGPSSINPTVIHADTVSNNLTPNRIDLVLDWRTTSETGDDVRQILSGLTEGLPATFESYDDWQSGPGGLKQPGFYTEASNPLVQQLQAAVLEKNPNALEPGIWQFATDGRHTQAAGIPTVGFGPGDATLAHTTRERIEVAEMTWHMEVLEKFLLEHTP